MTCSVQRKPALVFQPRDKNALSLQAQTYELFTSTLLRVRSSKKKSKKINHLVVDAEMLKNPRLSHRSVIESEPSLIQAPSVCSEAGARAAPYERKTRHDRTNNRKTIERKYREGCNYFFQRHFFFICKPLIIKEAAAFCAIWSRTDMIETFLSRTEQYIECVWTQQEAAERGKGRVQPINSYSNKQTLQERDSFWRKSPKIKICKCFIWQSYISAGHEHADVFKRII